MRGDLLLFFLTLIFLKVSTISKNFVTYEPIVYRAAEIASILITNQINNATVETTK